ncbi:MAG: (Fe-S)-binding protein [Oligoflexia bacterium]|nr:(Fe-S)-binding protein [Oligoflexia bacterium]MBF0364224.1 (Fe-S)-binding protein [Oligoflexia bacterium]
MSNLSPDPSLSSAPAHTAIDSNAVPLEAITFPSQPMMREIAWEIPPYYQLFFMYPLFLLAMLFLCKNLYTHFQFVNKGSEKLFTSYKDFNWGAFFKTITLQGKVLRSPVVARFHSLIFYSFLIHTLATTLVAIHEHSPFEIFQGTLYVAISFLADVAGIATLIGILTAYYRRYIHKPQYLEATQPKRELFMYAILASLVIIGFALEGIRIYAQTPELNALIDNREREWSPIGWWLAYALYAMGVKGSAPEMVSLYRGLWMFHMLSTMFFIGAIGSSKFLHILLIPFSALITPARRAGVISPMKIDLEGDSTPEYFGLAKVADLTQKQRFDLLACVECGRCTEACPARNAEKPLDPKKVVTKIRDHRALEDNALPPLFSKVELDSCTTCAACSTECPANIEHIQIINDVKRYQVLTDGDILPAAADVISNIKIKGNPWGITPDSRMDWIHKFHQNFPKESAAIEKEYGGKNIAELIRVLNPGETCDYLYFVGCAAAFDPNIQKTVHATMLMLLKAKVPFAILGAAESCNGDPIRRFGDEYSFQEVAMANIELFKQYKFSKIITHCPHCLHTLGKEYSKFDGGTYEVIPHTELLLQLKNEKRLELSAATKTATAATRENVTFHDPCYLGRHHGDYQSVRSLIHASGAKIHELTLAQDRSRCCGMGGGNMWYELPEGQHLAHNRLKDISEVHVEELITACPFCLINLESHKGLHEETTNLRIRDVSGLLVEKAFH